MCLALTHKHLDGVGEGQADSGGAQFVGEANGEAGHGQHQDGSVQVAPVGKPQVEALASEDSAVVGVVAPDGSLHEVVSLAEGLDHGQALQGLSHQADQAAAGGGAVGLELGSGGQEEDEHDEGHDEEGTSEDAEVLDDSRHRDDGGEHDQAVDACRGQGSSAGSACLHMP